MKKILRFALLIPFLSTVLFSCSTQNEENKIYYQVSFYQLSLVSEKNNSDIGNPRFDCSLSYAEGSYFKHDDKALSKALKPIFDNSEDLAGYIIYGYYLEDHARFIGYKGGWWPSISEYIEVQGDMDIYYFAEPIYKSDTIASKYPASSLNWD